MPEKNTWDSVLRNISSKKISEPEPIQVIKSKAPCREADEGGWTDIEKAEYGRVLSVAIYPAVNVQLNVYEKNNHRNGIEVYAMDFDENIILNYNDNPYDGQHDLIKAAINKMEIPDKYALEAIIKSEMPPANSTGTSASVSVALIGALDYLTPGRMLAHQIAFEAQQLEAKELKYECGIQDQLAAAYGGINFIDMYQYPYATVSRLDLDRRTFLELDDRMLLFGLNIPHASSDVHKVVLQNLGEKGPECEEFETLRQMPILARDALLAGDLKKFGQVMRLNTQAQRELHPDLISSKHQLGIDIAQKYGSWGEKANGAAGPGGSLTILAPADERVKSEMILDMEKHEFVYIPSRIATEGLRVWEVYHN